MADVKDIYVLLTANTTQFKAAMADAAATSDGFLGTVGGAAMGIAKLGLAVGAVAVGGAVVMAKMAADYQTLTMQLVTGAGESQKNLQMVSDGMLSMAGEVGISADNLAKGMFMIESAGYHGAAALDVLKASAEGAAVGGADFMTTANAVTTVMKDYAGAGITATDATNFLVAVVSQGKTHMEDLASSMAHVLPFASALKIPLEDVGGAMATMTAKGIGADNAATYLRFTMSALANETSKGKKALDEVGLSSTQVADTLTHQGLLAALEEVNTAIGNKFPAGSAQAFAALANITGGTRGLSASLQLTGQNLNDFIAATKTTADAIRNGHGAVSGWALTQQDFNQRWHEFTDGLDAAGIKIGQVLLPPLTEAVTWLGDRLPGAISALQGWWKEHEKTVEIVAKLISGALVGGFTALSKIISGYVVPALETMGKWIEIHVVPPLQELVNIIQQRVVPVLQWVVTNVIAPLLPPLTQLGEAILNLAQAALPIVGAAFAAAFAIGKQAWDAFGPVIINGIHVVTDVIKIFADFFQGKWGDMWNNIKKLAGDAIGGLVAFFIQLPLKLVGAFWGAAGALLGLGATLIGHIIEGLVHAVPGVISWFHDLPGNIWNGITGVWDTVVGWGAKIIANIVQGIKDHAGDVAKAIAGAVVGAGSMLQLSPSQAAAVKAAAGKATGGPVADGTYLVGERGPELLTIGSPGGTITPNVNMPTLGGNSAGNGQTVQFVIQNVTVQGVQDIRSLYKELRDESLNQARGQGILTLSGSYA